MFPSLRRQSARRLQAERLEERSLPSNLFTVTNTLDDVQPGSLRWAIAQVNGDTTDRLSSPDQIQFNIPQSDAGFSDGVWTIAPLTPLPAVANPVIIDGYTQPGAQPNTNGSGVASNAVLTVVLNETHMPQPAQGLLLSSHGIVVRGLEVDNPGTIFVPASGVGITIEAPGGDLLEGNVLNAVRVHNGANNTIGGTTPAAVNSVGDITLDGLDAAANLIVGNVGQSLTISGSSANTIGGTTAAFRNVFSEGISFSGVFRDLEWVTASHNLIEGNFIGTDVSGRSAVGRGMYIYGATGNTIGGAVPDAGNVIGAKLSSVPNLTTLPIPVFLADASDNVVEGNFIGMDSTATTSLGDTGPGMVLLSAAGNTIGGTVAGAGNVIAGNGGDGIWLWDDDRSTGNAIEGNTIFGNGGLGIRFPGSLGNVPLPNSPGGPHVGANHLQNAPVLKATNVAGGQTMITGTLNSTPGQTFRVEFFVNPTPDPSGYGQGKTFLGAINVTTGASGDSPLFAFVYNGDLTGQFLSATATDPGGNTSQFTRELAVPASLPTADLSVRLVSATPAALLGQGAVTWTYEVTNNGPDTAINVQVADYLPASLDNPSVSATLGNAFLGITGGDPKISLYTARDTIATIPSGQSFLFSVTGTPNVIGPFTDRFLMTADSFDLTQANDFASVSIPVLAKTSLHIRSTYPQPDTVGATSITVDVAGPSGTASPTGTVTLVDASTGTQLGTAPVVDGTASVYPRNMIAGDYRVTVIYSGDSLRFQGSTTNTILDVLRVQTVTTVAASPSTVVAGQPFTLMATVIPIPGLAAPPGVSFENRWADPDTETPVPRTGNVTFWDGTKILAIVPIGPHGVATLQVPGLSVGAHAITALYQGDANYGASVSPVSSLTVAPGDGPTVLSMSRSGVRSTPSTIVLAFSAPLDFARATDIGNYKLVGPGGRPVGISSAVYDPFAHTVTLRTASHLLLSRRYRLTVIGTGSHGLVDIYDNPLNGAGRRGSNFVTVLTARNLAR